MFNHGDDLEKSDACELIYREVDQFKPQSMVCGSHHMVLLSKQGPRNKYLDLSSVMLVSPRGSTIPLSLYEDLKVNFPNLAVILQIYAMSEVLMAISLSFDAQIALGSVGSDVMIKLVDTGYY